MLKLLCSLLAIASSTYAAITSVPKDLFIAHLPKNPVILEAGAQFGEDTAWMSQLWPQATIHAFEPFPEAYNQLQAVSNQHDNIHCYQLALSNTRGSLPFYVAGGASSLLKPSQGFNDVYFHADLLNPLMVEALTLDEWAAENNVSKIDFMWLDMEGHELHVLKASPRMLKTVKLIYLEVNLQKFWEGCAMHDDVRAWLKTQGFEEIWSEVTPGWQGNALYLRVKP